MCPQLSYHLPNLHNVVFRHGTDDPGLIGVPGEVRDLGCMTSMDKLDKENQKHHLIIMIQDDVTDNRDVRRLIRDSPVARVGHLQHLLVTVPLQFYYNTDS